MRTVFIPRGIVALCGAVTLSACAAFDHASAGDDRDDTDAGTVSPECHALADAGAVSGDCARDGGALDARDAGDGTRDGGARDAGDGTRDGGARDAGDGTRDGGGALDAGDGTGSEDGGALDGGGGDDAGATTTFLSSDRDRLLDTYAVRAGLADRCAVWAGFDEVQRGVFLTITDQLGRRSILDGSDDRALHHVVTLYAANGKRPAAEGGGCGNHEYNRLFYGVDDALLSIWRASGSGMAAWRASHDLGGPHAPFTLSDETNAGQPRGQVQFFKVDADAVTLDRNGVVGVLDTHIVEHDIDYDLVHNSCPECTYFGGTGRALYRRLWTPLGDGGDPEFEYAPSCP